MGMLDRMATLLKAKMNTVLENSENPNETLDYSYERQLDLLKKVKQGVVEVVTSKRRIEIQAGKVREQAATLEAQASQAVNSGRDDLARLALERKQVAVQQLEGLERQQADLEQEQQKLTLSEQRLSAKVNAFRTQKETLKAQYTAAEAQVRIGEAVHGLSEEMADLGLSVERAEQKTEKMRARAAAIDELADSGMLVDPTNPGADSLSRELAQIQGARTVDDELAKLKGQLGAGAAPKQLEGGR